MLRKDFYLTTCVSDIEGDVYVVRYNASVILEWSEVILNFLFLSRYAKKVVVGRLRDVVAELKLDYVDLLSLEKICTEFSDVIFSFHEIKKYDRGRER